MEEMLSGGTTLLFVSHSIETVKRLCTHALWLDHGDVIMKGNAQTVCDAYSGRQEQIVRVVKKETEEKKAKKTGNKYDYLIVGAGLFGAVFAREAYQAGKRCLVIDKRDHIGGNIYTEKEDNIQVHRYGAHIFHTSDKDIWNYVNQFAEFNHYINSPVAVYKDELYDLPFNMNTFNKLWGLRNPEEVQKKIKEQVADMHISEPQNLEEQALSFVGRDVYEKLIKGYTEKQWGRDCKELPPFIIQRIPLRFTYNNNYFDDPYQGIPKGGYTKMIQELLDGVDVKLNTDYKDFVKQNPDIFEKVIYTGPIDEYFGYSLGPLEYRSLRFETEKLNIPNYQGNAVVNYTDKDVPYTRIIEHKHFEFGNQPNTIISKEYPVEWHVGMEPYYPVNDQKNNDLYKKYRELAKKEDKVIFGGRLGSYKYYNMDQVIAAALDLVKKELKRKVIVNDSESLVDV